MQPFEVFRSTWQHNTKVQLRSPSTPQPRQLQPSSTQMQAEPASATPVFQFPYPEPKAMEGGGALMKAFAALADDEGIAEPKAIAAILAAVGRDVGGEEQLRQYFNA